MSNSNQCAHCDKILGADSPGGLCPSCLMLAGLEPESGSDANTTGLNSQDSIAEIAEIGELNELFPNFELLSLLGQGGMGSVYKARQVKLDRIVALKIIRPDAMEVQDFADRFQREARALAKLSHPNIVGIHDFGAVQRSNADGVRELYYLVMEFVDGVNLRDLLNDQSLESEKALAIVPQICNALQFAHDAGVVHRDIKPENILLDKFGNVKIADFGLAKIAGDEGANYNLTRTHQVMGTPKYMAPEQLEKTRNVDHRADIYSLGVVFYEMLTGELPIGQFEMPSQKVDVDVRLDQIVLRSLAKEPERRYQTASHFKTDVDSIGNDDHRAVPPIVGPAIPVNSGALDKASRTMLVFGLVTVLLSACAFLIVLFLVVKPFVFPVVANSLGLLFQDDGNIASSSESHSSPTTMFLIVEFLIVAVVFVLPTMMMGGFLTLVAKSSLARENYRFCKFGGWMSLIPIYVTWPIGCIVGINYLLALNRFTAQTWVKPPGKLDPALSGKRQWSGWATMGVALATLLALSVFLPWSRITMVHVNVTLFGIERIQGLIVLAAALISIVLIAAKEMLRLSRTIGLVVPAILGMISIGLNLHYIYQIKQPAKIVNVTDGFEEFGEAIATMFTATGLSGMYISLILSILFVAYCATRVWFERKPGAAVEQKNR